MPRWNQIVKENGFGDYIGSVQMIYDLYKDREEFSEELFHESVERAAREESEQGFFIILIKALVMKLDYQYRYSRSLVLK